MIRAFNANRPMIANSAFVSEGAYVVGDVAIGERSNVWPGAVIRGDFGRIVIGKPTEKQLLWVKGGNREYGELAKRYKAEGL